MKVKVERVYAGVFLESVIEIPTRAKTVRGRNNAAINYLSKIYPSATSISIDWSYKHDPKRGSK